MQSTNSIDKSNFLKQIYETLLKKLWVFILYGWPIPVILLIIPIIYEILEKCQFPNSALYFFLYSKLFLLATALWMHFYKIGKTLGITLIIGFSFKQVIFSYYQILVSMLEPSTSFKTLYEYSPAILANALLTILSLRACSYLMSTCRYREIFSLNKVQLLPAMKKITGSEKALRITKRFCEIILENGTRSINLIWKYKDWFLGCWSIPVFYFIWFQNYMFLSPESDRIEIIQHLKLSSIPLGILLVSLILFKPLALTNRSGLILASLANIFAGYYGAARFYDYYTTKLPALLQTHDLRVKLQLMWSVYESHNSWVILLDLFIFGIGVCSLIKTYASYLKLENRAKPFKKSSNYGTAKFLDLKGIKKINAPNGITIGAIPKISTFNKVDKIVTSIKKYGGTDLIRIKTSHTTLVAPSRTGKGVGVIIPVLLEYPGPVFVTDVKGENYTIVKRAREGLQRKVIAFDPFGLTNSLKIKINPLKFLNPKSIEVVDDAQTLANLICPVSPRDGTNANHFQSQAAAVIQCLLLYVVCSGELSEKDKTLSYIYDLLCRTQDELTVLLEQIGKNHNIAFGSAARLANSIVGAHPEERSGILSSARVELRFIDTLQVRQATGDSDFMISDITKGETDLFVCIPLEKLSTQHRLLRLLTGIVFIEMQKARGKIGKHNLLMVLDEMPALGHMKQIEEMLVYGGGFGISLLVVSQTIEFLQSVYPNTWKTFFSNQLSIFFGCSDPMTSKFVSEKLGKKTISVDSVNEGSGNQKRGFEISGTSSLQAGNSTSETGRDLLMPDEVERLGERVVLAFDRGEFPIICQRIDYRERAEWKGLWDENLLHLNREAQSSINIYEYFKNAFQIIMG